MNPVQPRLTLYLAAHCMGHETALQLAQKAAKHFPGWQIETVDLDRPQATAPATVIGTPTWVANGQVIFHGNPAWSELAGRMRSFDVLRGGPAAGQVDQEAAVHG